MNLHPKLERFLMTSCDQFFSAFPQKRPAKKLLEDCLIISHRGIHDQRKIKENTMDAFVLAEEKGVYGIELDFRWTRDLVPVVVHDPDLERVFGMDVQIAEHDFESLKSLCPSVPSLQQVVERFGNKMHLMIEVKHEPYPNPEHQNTILEAIFSNLIPGQDYHLISLDPEMLELIECVPDHAKMPVAELNVGKLSEIALEKNYAGVLGHYFLLHGRLVQKHLEAGQKVGTGYPDSRNCMSRELNRGVNWLFSNDAGGLEQIRKAMLAEDG